MQFRGSVVIDYMLLCLTIRWEYVVEYSKDISSLLGGPKLPPSPIIEDPKAIFKVLFHLSVRVELRSALWNYFSMNLVTFSKRF